MASSIKNILSVVLHYDTIKFITVKNKKIGLLNRVIQLAILSYILGYAIIFKKGYQDFSDLESAVTTKVKGVVFTNFSDEEFEPEVPNKALYKRVWDVPDYVVPPSENNAFFVATNVIITPNQKQGVCNEDETVEGALCDPDTMNNTCDAGKILHLGNGPMTGKCVNESGGNFSCQINGWCPLELDKGPLKTGALLDDIKKSTVLIKNFISFTKYGVTRRNVLDTSNKTYLNSCTYHPLTNDQCPVFVIDDIIRDSGENFSEVAVKGAVFEIRINWNCDLDYSPKNCIPTYSFKRLDEPNALLAKGWNFRYANYYRDDTRTLYKLYGIDFVVLVTGTGGKFNLIPLLLNIGSGIGLLALATVISDLAVLYCVKKKNLYKTKKYVEVETEYDGFHDVSNRENDVPSDFAYQRQP